jgi:hypothetical protein
MKFPLLHSLVFLLIITGVARPGCSVREQGQNEIILAIDSHDGARILNAILGETETKDIYVADEQMAINIAVKAWISIYGNEQIESERPYIASLKKGIWTVHGSLPKDMDGGVALAKIRQKDGKVLKIIHGK